MIGRAASDPRTRRSRLERFSNRSGCFPALRVKTANRYISNPTTS